MRRGRCADCRCEPAPQSLRTVRPYGGAAARPYSGRRGPRERAVRGDDPAVRQELTGVLEEQDAVAQQAPALLRVVRQKAGGFPVGGVGGGTRWLVLAHWWDLSLCCGHDVPRVIAQSEPSVAPRASIRRYFASPLLHRLE